jgi:hypothetical protein
VKGDNQIMVSSCRRSVDCGTEKFWSVSSRKVKSGNQRWRRCAGEVSRVEHKNGVQCPRVDFRLTAKNLCQQAPFRGFHPRNLVSVVERCPVGQPKITSGYRQSVEGGTNKSALVCSRIVQGDSQKIASVCRWSVDGAYK